MTEKELKAFLHSIHLNIKFAKKTDDIEVLRESLEEVETMLESHYKEKEK